MFKYKRMYEKIMEKYCELIKRDLENGNYIRKLLSKLVIYAGNYDMRKAIAEHREEYIIYLDKCIKYNNKVSIQKFIYVDNYLNRINEVLHEFDYCGYHACHLKKYDTFQEHINYLGIKILEKLRKNRNKNTCNSTYESIKKAFKEQNKRINNSCDLSGNNPNK